MSKDLISKYYHRFTKAQNAVAGKHKKWKELDTFDRGEQWASSNIPAWLPKPVTNYIRYVRTVKRANLTSNIPKSKFTAVDAEDVEVVEHRLQKAHDHVWEAEKIPRTVRRAIDRALLLGTAIVYVYEEDIIDGKYYGDNDPKNLMYRGDIRVKRIANSNFFPDPDAYSLDTCKYIEMTELVPLDSIKNNPAFREYAEKNKHTKKLQDLKLPAVEEDSTSGEIYERDHYVSNMNNTQVGDEMVTLHAHFERYRREDGKWQLDVSYYLKDTDFFLLRIEDIQPNEYPFAVLYDEEEEFDFWGSSLIMDFLENQKTINKMDQVTASLTVLNQNPQKIVSRESGIHAKDLANTGTLPGQALYAHGDPSRAVHVLKPAEPPRTAFEIKDRMASDIRELSGINEAYTGQSVGSLTTSTGVQSLIERATIRDRDKFIQIDEFVERISHLIMLFILHRWKDARPITNTSADGNPEYDMFYPVDEITADNLKWRVHCNAYATSPITQASKRQQADKLLQMQGQFQFNPPVITPEEWVKFQDFDMKDEILERMKQDRERMEAMQAQDMAQTLLAMAEGLDELKRMGVPPEQYQQYAYQMAQQMLNPQQPQATQGTTPENEVQAPQGHTSQSAMMAMTSGTM